MSSITGDQKRSKNMVSSSSFPSRSKIDKMLSDIDNDNANFTTYGLNTAIEHQTQQRQNVLIHNTTSLPVLDHLFKNNDESPGSTHEPCVSKDCTISTKSKRLSYFLGWDNPLGNRQLDDDDMHSIDTIKAANKRTSNEDKLFNTDIANTDTTTSTEGTSYKKKDSKKKRSSSFTLSRKSSYNEFTLIKNYSRITIKEEEKKCKTSKKTPSLPPKDEESGLTEQNAVASSKIPLLYVRVLSTLVLSFLISTGLISYSNNERSTDIDPVDVTRTTLEDSTHQNVLEEDNGIAMEKLITAYVTKEESEYETSELVNATMEKDTIELPTSLQNIQDITSKRENSTIPFFFHVPLTSGTMIQTILSTCYNKTQVSNFYHVTNNTTTEEPLHTYSTLNNTINYMNINTEVEEDIQRAIKYNLVTYDNMFISSSQLHLSSKVFTPSHQGKLFTLIRHPIHRASHLYHVKRQRLSSNMTIVEYADSEYVESNWLTRFLSDNKQGVLTNEDLEVAKEVLKRKCLVGIMDDVYESMNRFLQYLNLDIKEQCCTNIVQQAINENENYTLEEGSKEWNVLLKRNAFDMKVYEYAVELFNEQGMKQGVVSDL